MKIKGIMVLLLALVVVTSAGCKRDDDTTVDQPSEYTESIDTNFEAMGTDMEVMGTDMMPPEDDPGSGTDFSQ